MTSLVKKRDGLFALILQRSLVLAIKGFIIDHSHQEIEPEIQKQRMLQMKPS